MMTAGMAIMTAMMITGMTFMTVMMVLMMVTMRSRVKNQFIF